MDDDGPPQLAGQRDLTAEHLDLGLARREVVVVVQPDLADRAGAVSRLERPTNERRDAVVSAGRVFDRTGLVRMDADRKRDIRPGLGHAVGPHTLFFVQRVENAQGAVDPRGAGARDHRVEVGGELLVGQVAVGIDHRIADPAGARSGSSGVSNTGWPSASRAARTMPFDSIPISFAGCRFATNTTCRPTRRSGS